jgi:ureidoglycolate lyase
MNDRILRPEPLTADAFAPFGDVVQSAEFSDTRMNEARFARFDDLVGLDVITDPPGRPGVSIARCNTPSVLPYRVEMMERHPLGSQAFIPLQEFEFFVVVAPPGEGLDESAIRAFRSNGKQGINYRRGTWHMPLIALQQGQTFLIIDRFGEGDNCEQFNLTTPCVLEDAR